MAPIGGQAIINVLLKSQAFRPLDLNHWNDLTRHKSIMIMAINRYHRFILGGSIYYQAHDCSSGWKQRLCKRRNTIPFGFIWCFIQRVPTNSIPKSTRAPSKYRVMMSLLSLWVCSLSLLAVSQWEWIREWAWEILVSSSFDFIITTSTSDKECVWVCDCVSVRLKGRCPNPNVAPV